MTELEKLDRARIEAQRGVFRDSDGKILRSDIWLRDRISHLTNKILENERRNQTMAIEILERKAELSLRGVQVEVKLPFSQETSTTTSIKELFFQLVRAIWQKVVRHG